MTAALAWESWLLRFGLEREAAGVLVGERRGGLGVGDLGVVQDRHLGESAWRALVKPATEPARLPSATWL